MPAKIKSKRMLFIGAACISLFLLSANITSPSHIPNETAETSETENQEIYTVVLAAYSSTPEQTDSRPEETAAQTRVRAGIVAANFLPFGTLIKIPEFFGDKIFVVEDRLHERKSYIVDIWMSDTESAKTFGAHLTDILVLQKPKL